MAHLTKGYTFSEGEQLTPEKMNTLLNNAGVTEISGADLTVEGSALRYGPTVPSVSPGLLWYSTTAGHQGLYFGSRSSSNASVSGWIGLMPRREVFVMATTTVSFGNPLFIGPRPGDDNERFARYDGSFFLYGIPFYNRDESIFGTSNTVPPGGALISMESRMGCGIVRAAWAGIVPAPTPGTNVSLGHVFSVNIADPETPRNFITAQSNVLGVALQNAPNTGTSEAPWLMWGGPGLFTDINA